mmetsp:Transcript_79096/g.157263  ORF Transcript_79096/g.157263 Transcript_79096/m.157263 type:complete len:86 (+) Transcript_79096:252-509(+)
MSTTITNANAQTPAKAVVVDLLYSKVAFAWIGCQALSYASSRSMRLVALLRPHFALAPCLSCLAHRDHLRSSLYSSDEDNQSTNP